ncbi:Peroxidase [Parasponia andersonii]|uniref:peroxidase n=1 Tax=Parasponia andersonii TaxID=3476 RepID=A0A2P5DE19_PARAD|nr:Peroxidase [Parasponia andersonii]
MHHHGLDHSCPKAQEIVKSVVAKAVAREARIAASLLRLHFHDCFVKRSAPALSCADILALVARDKTVLCWTQLGGPTRKKGFYRSKFKWLKQRYPSSKQHFQTILTKFKRQGLDIVDLVALSGSHTIGNALCTSFRQRLCNQSGNGQPDSTLEQSYAAQLRSRCPRSGGDQNLFFLDFGLLNSDQVLVTSNEESKELVEKYAENNGLFFEQFAKSIAKTGNMYPLTGSRGEIRKNCRKINTF